MPNRRHDDHADNEDVQRERRLAIAAEQERPDALTPRHEMMPRGPRRPVTLTIDLNELVSAIAASLRAVLGTSRVCLAEVDVDGLIIGRVSNAKLGAIISEQARNASQSVLAIGEEVQS